MTASKTTRLLTWLAIAALVAIGWIIISADGGKLPLFITALYAFPYGDKVGHFLIMGALTLAANLIASGRRVNVRSTPMLLGTLLVFIGVTIEEFSQIFFQNRTFSLVDLGFSYLGILTADLAVRLILKSVKHEDATS